MKIKVGIIGGAGYTGGELIRLLVNHPHADIKFIHSRSNARKPVSSVHQDLVGEELTFSADISNEVDVLFLCLGHGESKKFLQEHTIDSSVKVIDFFGKVIIHKKLSENYIDIKSLSKGTYFLEIEGRKPLKFIKK